MVALAQHHANLRKEYLQNVSEVSSEDEETKYNSRARADRQAKREELILRNRVNVLNGKSLINDLTSSLPCDSLISTQQSEAVNPLFPNNYFTTSFMSMLINRHRQSLRRLHQAPT